MYLRHDAPKFRLKEAQNARDNRAEIVKARSQGQVTRRELFKWGLFTTTGMVAMTNGLSAFAKSSFGNIPTGVPPSPQFGAVRFDQACPRLKIHDPVDLTKKGYGRDAEAVWPKDAWGSPVQEFNSKRLSWHTEYSDTGEFTNLLTQRGPMEGRPPGEWFAFQKWDEYFPTKGYVMSMGQIHDGVAFHRNMPYQQSNKVWSFNKGAFTRGTLAPPLLKAAYGSPMLGRVYNNLPINRAENGGFGRNEIATHLHNAHNGAESDGAANTHHFPGTFYDYHWSTCLARADTINVDATDPRASGPDGKGGLNYVPGDFRELQGTLWFHDHRFFFTAENVYKGNAAMINYYSGPDRGNEEPNYDDGVNHRLPSGWVHDFGNVDFDMNILIADMAFDQEGQYFFDIFDTDGFLGDMLHVNFAYYPYIEVLPRKYRFRLLNACMSRFLKLAFVDEGTEKNVPFQLIANDGNFLVNPLDLDELDQQSVAERYDIIIDFSKYSVGDTIQLVNTLQFKNGRVWDKELSVQEALSGESDDPCVGKVAEIRVVSSMQSVDDPNVTLFADSIRDTSRVPLQLTEPIPIVEPVRERFIEWTKGSGDSRDTSTGECIPDCGDKESFPWTVRINGESAHALNAERISNLIPDPGAVEHWTLINGGGGWDHPIHLHTEEGVTIDRGKDSIPASEKGVRKDVWRLRPGGSVKFQVRFGEFGGAYVNHCHNTVHEDNAMLTRYQILTEKDGSIHNEISPTPHPSPDGVKWSDSFVLPEGDPANPKYFEKTGGSGKG